MNVEYVARHFDLDDEIRSYTEGKLRKVAKFVDDPVDVRVTLVQEKHRHIAEVKVGHRHGVIQATEETSQMPDAINLAVDKVEKQARRARKKFMDQRRRNDRRAEGVAWPLEVIEGEGLRSGERRVVRRSMVEIELMDVEEAALKLDASNDEFLVFKDASNDRVSVLYKRSDGNFGLISPGD